jgi:hypothetical protein
MRYDGTSLMQPNGQYIELTPAEQTEFDLPARLEKLQAVVTALAFREVVVSMVDRNIQDIDVTNPEVMAKIHTRNLRADRLASFASRVCALCPDEHLQIIMNPEAATRQ